MSKQDENKNEENPSRRQQNQSNKKDRKKSLKPDWLPKNKRTYWILGSATLLVILCALAFKLYSDVTGFGSDIYEDVGAERIRDADKQLQNGEPITILLTGTDSGALYYEDVEEARTDVMMVITINPKTDESTVVSVPRDALGIQSDTTEFDKLNHAYMNYDGIEGTINSLQQYLDIPIDYYVNVNMQGFMDIIDALGGVDITPTLSFTQNGESFTEGETRTLSGLEAMQYVRMRKSDPEGDIGREKRQQQLIDAVVDKVISLGTITNYNDILDALGDNVKTNITVDNMFALQSKYLSAMDNLNKLVFDNYVDLNLDYGYYMLVTEQERLEIVSQLHANLEYEGNNNLIVYPSSFGVESTYFPVNDLNWDGVLSDDEMAIQPGVYSREDLNELVKYIFGYSINDYLESTGNTELIDESDDQTIPTSIPSDLALYITAGFDPDGTVSDVYDESEAETEYEDSYEDSETDTNSDYADVPADEYSEPYSEEPVYEESSEVPSSAPVDETPVYEGEESMSEDVPVESEQVVPGATLEESTVSE